MQMNRIEIAGFLASRPEIRYLPSGTKVANVDANIYPAGFNNICPTDRENCGPPARPSVKC